MLGRKKCTHRFLGTAGMAHLLEPCGEGPELVRKLEEEGRLRPRVFTRVFPGRNGRGEVHGVSLRVGQFE